VLKPASLTPVGALIIGEVLAEAGLPRGAFSVLPARRDGADLFTTDPRLKLLSFTGSPAVGWDLKARAGKKKVVLELGGNAAVIVDADSDLTDAVARIVFGAFYQSGQSCIGVQRVLAHADLYGELRDRLVAATRALPMGDPKDEKTFIGPMISEGEAKRLHGWIEAARSAGARVLCGGARQGAMLEATLLEDVPRNLDVVCQEAFGPVAVLSQFTDFERGARRGERQQLRAPGRSVHARPVQGAARVGPARGRRRGDRRRAVVARRSHALRRRQGLGARPRGDPIRDRGHDRDPAARDPHAAAALTRA
jgi:acyl-CoA reductase-like NAD-dependent aldehyde dehydrogenase